MREQTFLNIIKNTLTDSSFIGDDCAYLKEFDLCMTHDSLCEGVHFLLSTSTPYELGQKAVNVNLSDLAASGANPLYLTISLSLPHDVENDFVKSFYEGVNDACLKYGVTVAGGDLTGADKVFVSVCAIGKKINDVRVTRSAAKAGDVVAVTGFHGDSAGGLKLLQEGKNVPENLVKKHLMPEAQCEKSNDLMQSAKVNGLKEFAMMDSSDGLGDALLKLSQGCGLAFDIDFDAIPVSEELKQAFPLIWNELAIWGGEDFELVFCMPESVFEKLDSSKFFKIGVVSKKPLDEQTDELFKDFPQKGYEHF